MVKRLILTAVVSFFGGAFMVSALPERNYYEISTENLKRAEAFRGMPYQDSYGNWTIGYGTLLPLAESQAELLLIDYQLEMDRFLRGHFRDWDSFTENRKAALVEMCYTMGPGRFMTFKEMNKAIRRNNWDDAAKEAQDSKWYREDVGEARGKRVVNMIKRG